MGVCHTEKASQYNPSPQICQHIPPEEVLLYHHSLILLRTLTMDTIILSKINPYSTFSYCPYNIIYSYFFSIQHADENYSLHLIPIVVSLYVCLEQSLSPPHHPFLLVFHVINMFKEPKPTDFAVWPSVYSCMIDSPILVLDYALWAGMLPAWCCVLLSALHHRRHEAQLSSCLGISFKMQRSWIIL